ncbi:MAG: hypothetical protein AB7I19_04490 [Planctomycetota bacterium]
MTTPLDTFRKVRTRARRGIWLEGLAALVVAGLAWTAVSFAVDRFLQIETVYRAGLLIVLAFVVGRIVMTRLARPLGTALDDREVALALERGDRGLAQGLISAVQFEGDLAAGRARGQSDALMHGVIAAMRSRAGDLDPAIALDRARITRAVRRLVVATLLGVGLVAGLGDSFGIWFRRNLLLGNEPWPRATQLSFRVGEQTSTLRIAERDDVTLVVVASGVIPDRVSLDVTFDSGERSRHVMDRGEGDTFLATIPGLLADATAIARGGDGETAPLRLMIVARPRLAELSFGFTPPAYLGTTEQPLEPVAGEMSVPRGSVVQVRGRSTKPLARIALVRGGQSRQVAEPSSDAHRFALSFQPDASGTLALEISDLDGLSPQSPIEFLLRVLDDTAPQLEFLTRGVGSMITANARIPGRLRLRDDHGVTTVAAASRVTEAIAAEGSDEAPAEAPFEPFAPIWEDEFQSGAADSELGVVFDLQPTMTDPDPHSMRNRVRPDTFLSLRFTAADNKAPAPQEATSEVRTFRVVTPEKLLQELRRRQNEQRRDLEKVKQKVVDARAEVVASLSPTAESPEAPRARSRLDQLARQQTTLGKTVQTIADRYQTILDEMLNNRLFEANLVRGMESRIVSPLVTAAIEGFPESAQLLTGFSEDGKEATRSVAIEAIDALLALIDRVLEQMDRNEDLAAIVESLRVVIRSEAEAQALVKRLRDAAGSGIFGDEKREDKDKSPNEQRK